MNRFTEIKEIDTNFAVESIKVNQKEFWPFLKIFFFDQFLPRGASNASPTKKVYVSLVLAFFYGFRNWFKKADHLVFSNSGERKYFDGLWVDKSADYINKALPNTLHIELPVYSHYPKNKLPYKNVVSFMPVKLLEIITSYRIKGSLQIEGHSVLNEINAKYNVDFKMDGLAARFMSEYIVMKRILKWKKPKAVFMVVPYMRMGAVLACKEMDVKVVEMQHGVIDVAHFGYINYKECNANLYPNHLLAYGSLTKELFQLPNKTYTYSNVHPIGHYFLNLISDSPLKESVYSDQIKAAEKVIAVSLFDLKSCDTMIEVLAKVAEEKTNWLFLFVPRKTPEHVYLSMGLPKNILLMNDLNIYECIKYSDIHTTVVSTCAIESNALGKPNVLVNVNGLAELKFNDVLSNESTKYAQGKEDYISLIEDSVFPKEEGIKKSIAKYFAAGFQSNLDQVLPEILKDSN